MELTRIYDKTDLARFEVEKAEHIKANKDKLAAFGVPEELHDTIALQMAQQVVKAPRIVMMKIVHTGSAQAQQFSTETALQGLSHGWMTIKGDKLTIKGDPEDLVYTIRRRPGRYCLHCGRKLLDDLKGDLARLHVLEEHPGVPSPDLKGHPAGYEMINYFDTLLNADQHERYKIDVSTLRQLEDRTKSPDESKRSWFTRLLGVRS